MRPASLAGRGPITLNAVVRRGFPALLVMVSPLLCVLASCGAGQPGAVVPATVGQLRAVVDAGPRQLQTVTTQLEETERDIGEFAATHGPGWRERGYMTARENERMEHLLFQYVSGTDVLAGWVESLGGDHSDKAFSDPKLTAGAHILVVDSQFLLTGHHARMVSLFQGDPVAVAKLNEAFPRVGLPRGSFDACRRSVSSPDTAQRVLAAWLLFEKEMEDDDIRSLIASDPGYAELVARIPEDHRRAAAAVIEAGGDTLVARIKHSAAAALVREATEELGDLRYEARSLLFKDVSRIKSPTAKVLVFSPGQHRQVKELLEPGDIILTYTAGYASDAFIPGSFKHGITYVGTPAQRKAAGMSRGLATDGLSDGRRADVIEAVAEGVIFNDLGHLMDTHVNRMVVLRPLYGAGHRAGYLDEVSSYLGESYDFRFDFADASRQVCTEVIYRGMNGRRGIDFPLTRRGGHPTLSADDIVEYHFRTGGEHFEVVLYAEEAAFKPGNRAAVWTGSEADRRLRRQMADR